MKKLILVALLFIAKSSTAQCFPIRAFSELPGFLPLSYQDTLFIEDLIGEGQDPLPEVLDCFVFKYSEWNYLITYKLKDCEKLYVIKDGYIGPIYIYKDKKVQVLKNN